MFTRVGAKGRWTMARGQTHARPVVRVVKKWEKVVNYITTTIKVSKSKAFCPRTHAAAAAIASSGGSNTLRVTVLSENEEGTKPEGKSCYFFLLSQAKKNTNYTNEIFCYSFELLVLECARSVGTCNVWVKEILYALVRNGPNYAGDEVPTGLRYRSWSVLLQ